MAIARAIAAKPQLLLLDDPTSGLDRIIATTVLHDGQICFEGTATELRASRDRYLREFLFMALPPW